MAVGQQIDGDMSCHLVQTKIVGHEQRARANRNDKWQNRERIYFPHKFDLSTAKVHPVYIHHMLWLRGQSRGETDRKYAAIGYMYMNTCVKAQLK